MGAGPSGRVLLICGSVLALLATDGVVASPTPTAAAAPARVESAWNATVGAGGANGSATVRVYDTARGSVALSLRGLAPTATYAAVMRRGTCGALGSQLLGLGTFRSTASGALSASAPLTVAQAAALRAATGGTSRVSLVAGSGSRARCGTLTKSVAVSPQIWFAPLPAGVPAPGFGSSDYASLFTANAPWPRVAGRTHVFVFQGFSVAGSSGTADERRMIDALKARQIRIGIDWYALPPQGGCGVDVNGFGGGADLLLAQIRRIRSLGGTVSYVSISEPFSGGVLWDGPNACHWSVATVAQKLAVEVKRVRAAHPALEIGLIEAYNAPAWIGYAKQWIGAYEAAVGERLPYYHLDADFTAQGWADGAAQIQAYVRGRGTRFGILYTTWPPAASDAEWFAETAANVREFELDHAGPPDDALFQVNEKPDRLLPESGATTMTRLMADYTRTRTAITVTGTPAPAGGTIAVNGSLRTIGADPVTGTMVRLAATPRDGTYQVMEFAGTVPAGRTHALVQMGVNLQGPLPAQGSTDLTFYEFGYAEGPSTANLVPRPHFEDGLEGWRPWGDGSLMAIPSDRGTGQMLRAAVSPTQTLGSNSTPFSVTPGAAYRMWVAVRVPEASIGHAYVATIFLKDVAALQEASRDMHPLAPAPIALGSAATDATGRFSLLSNPLDGGRYWLVADYPGDPTYWPARAKTDVTVP